MQVVQQVLKWEEVMAAVQKDRERLMRMHCHVDFERVESMGTSLLSELIKPRHCVAVIDALALDLVLLYNNPPPVSGCDTPGKVPGDADAAVMIDACEQIRRVSSRGIGCRGCTPLMLFWTWWGHLGGCMHKCCSSRALVSMIRGYCCCSHSQSYVQGCIASQALFKIKTRAMHVGG